MCWRCGTLEQARVCVCARVCLSKWHTQIDISFHFRQNTNTPWFAFLLFHPLCCPVFNSFSFTFFCVEHWECDWQATNKTIKFILSLSMAVFFYMCVHVYVRWRSSRFDSCACAHIFFHYHYFYYSPIGLLSHLPCLRIQLNSNEWMVGYIEQKAKKPEFKCNHYLHYCRWNTDENGIIMRRIHNCMK